MQPLTDHEQIMLLIRDRGQEEKRITALEAALADYKKAVDRIQLQLYVLLAFATGLGALQSLSLFGLVK